MAEKINHTEFFLERSLYAPVKIDIENIVDVLDILYCDKRVGILSSLTLDVLCPECDEVKTKTSTWVSFPSSIQDDFYVISNNDFCRFNEFTGMQILNNPEQSLDLIIRFLEEQVYFSRIYSCPKVGDINSHNLIFYMKVQDGKLLKIGQSHSVADLQRDQIENLKVLGNDIYKEYNMAIGLGSHGVGIGSFVYLRRIIEKYIVIPEGEKMIEAGLISKKEFYKMRFSEKINSVKGNIPEFLVQNKSIYGILSKGIHELTESDCKRNFSVVKAAIDFVLEELIDKKRREKRKLDLAAELEKIR